MKRGQLWTQWMGPSSRRMLQITFPVPLSCHSLPIFPLSTTTDHQMSRKWGFLVEESKVWTLNPKDADTWNEKSSCPGLKLFDDMHYSLPSWSTSICSGLSTWFLITLHFLPPSSSSSFCTSLVFFLCELICFKLGFQNLSSIKTIPVFQKLHL